MKGIVKPGRYGGGSGFHGHELTVRLVQRLARLMEVPAIKKSYSLSQCHIERISQLRMINSWMRIFPT